MEPQNGEDTDYTNDKDNPGNDGGIAADKTENKPDKPLQESISKVRKDNMQHSICKYINHDRLRE